MTNLEFNFIKIHECEYCKKEFETNLDCPKSTRFCSRKCISGNAGKIGGSKGGKKAAEINRINKTGPFFNSEIQSKMGKRGVNTSRIKRVGFCFDKELQSKGGKEGIKTNKINKTGLFNSEIRSLGRKKCKELGRGLYDPKVKSLGGKVGSKITIEILRQKKRIIFKGVYYDSYNECEIAMCIYYQLEKLIENKNYQVRIGNLTYDFLIKKYKCIIENHPYNKLYDGDDLELKEYYKLRKNNLDKNGYEKYSLIIIK